MRERLEAAFVVRHGKPLGLFGPLSCAPLLVGEATAVVVYRYIVWQFHNRRQISGQVVLDYDS